MSRLRPYRDVRVCARGDPSHSSRSDCRARKWIWGACPNYSAIRCAAHQASWRRYVNAIGENNIRPGLFSLLVLVRSNPGIVQIELGTHLGVDKASIVALLDRLEHAGLIERRRCTRDRRRQGIFLTDSGFAQLDKLLPQVRHLERQLAACFSKTELEQLLGLLQRFYA